MGGGGGALAQNDAKTKERVEIGYILAFTRGAVQIYQALIELYQGHTSFSLLLWPRTYFLGQATSNNLLLKTIA